MCHYIPAEGLANCEPTEQKGNCERQGHPCETQLAYENIVMEALVSVSNL